MFAALAVTRYIENATDWSIKKFVRTTRRYRTVQIEVAGHLVAHVPRHDIHRRHARLLFDHRFDRLKA